MISAREVSLKLQDFLISLCNDPEVTKIDVWTEWKIPLQVFADQGVDLTNVDTITIGFGDKNNLQAGGSGTMFIDDVRLYLP